MRTDSIDANKEDKIIKNKQTNNKTQGVKLQRGK